MDWVKKIKDLRHFEGLKQDALAVQLGVSQASVSQWERGVVEPPLSVQEKLRERLAATPAARFLESLRVSVRTSPNVAGLLIRRNGVPVFELISDSSAILTDFLHSDDVGKPIRGLFGPHADDQLGQLIEAGLFEGRVESANAVSILRRNGQVGRVVLSLTSFRVPYGDVVVRLEVRSPTDAEREMGKCSPSLDIVQDPMC